MQGGPQPYSPPPLPPRTQNPNIFAILGLVMAFVCWPAGIVLSIIARRQIRETGEPGDGLALAGLVISCAFLALTLIALIAVVAAISSVHPS